MSSASWWHPGVRYKGEDVFGATENYGKMFQAKYQFVPDYAQASASAAGSGEKVLPVPEKNPAPRS